MAAGARELHAIHNFLSHPSHRRTTSGTSARWQAPHGIVAAIFGTVAIALARRIPIDRRSMAPACLPCRRPASTVLAFPRAVSAIVVSVAIGSAERIPSGEGGGGAAHTEATRTVLSTDVALSRDWLMIRTVPTATRFTSRLSSLFGGRCLGANDRKGWIPDIRRLMPNFGQWPGAAGLLSANNPWKRTRSAPQAPSVVDPSRTQSAHRKVLKADA